MIFLRISLQNFLSLSSSSLSAFNSPKRVASLCKEWNLQGKENGREMVDLAMCGICKERKMPGKIKLNLQGKEIARNGICKKTVLQVEVTFFITRLM